MNKNLKKIKIEIFKIILFSPLFIYLGKRSLIAYDEGYYVLQSRWILENENWIAPMWFDKIILDRTIGIQYILAVSQKIFGQNNFGIFMPILLSSIIMAYLTYLIHRELLNDKYAIISPLILTTSFLWINYANIASQDIIFATIITFGIYANIKASKSNKKIFYFLASVWIGLGFMMKTYLTFIPLISILPIFIKNRLIFKKLFWLGLFSGFFPFIFWSYSILNKYDFYTYSGLFRKLLILSNENNFSKPIYYYIWNLPANIFPWTFFLFLGFFISYKAKNNLVRYFLFIYPLITLSLLSIFSTKTPYYPLQVLSITSVNIYLSIISLTKNNNFLIRILKLINFNLIPIILIISLISFKSEIENLNLSNQQIILLYLGIISFSISWLLTNILKNINSKIFLILVGPYLLFISIFQSGLLTDRSKDMRIASEYLIKEQNLDKQFIHTIKSDVVDDLSHSKLIKILLNMPKVGKGISNLSDLKTNQYAWTTTSENNLNKLENINIINDSKIFKPWRLIFKK